MAHDGLFIYDSFFPSKRSKEAMMDVGSEMICIVKTNTKGLYKDTIKKTSSRSSCPLFLRAISFKGTTKWACKCLNQFLDDF